MDRSSVTLSPRSARAFFHLREFLNDLATCLEVKSAARPASPVLFCAFSFNAASAVFTSELLNTRRNPSSVLLTPSLFDLVGESHATDAAEKTSLMLMPMSVTALDADITASTVWRASVDVTYEAPTLMMLQYYAWEDGSWSQGVVICIESDREERNAEISVGEGTFHVGAMKNSWEALRFLPWYETSLLPCSNGYKCECSFSCSFSSGLA